VVKREITAALFFIRKIKVDAVKVETSRLFGNDQANFSTVKIKERLTLK